VNLKEGDIVGHSQTFGRIQWIDKEKAGIQNLTLNKGYLPLFNSSYVEIKDLEFIHRKLDLENSQLMFSFFIQLQREEDEKQRRLIEDYLDKKDRERGVSEKLLINPKQSVEVKVMDKIKGMSVDEILKLLED